jgi:ACS family tartrate transporter-like MFS transporter
MLSVVHSIEISVVLLSAVAACVCVYLGPFWALPSEFLSGPSAASGIALVTTFVNVGGFVGPYVACFIRTRTGSLYGAFAFAGIVLFVFATLVLMLSREARLSVSG